MQNKNTSKQAKTVRVSLQALINKFSIKNNHAATRKQETVQYEEEDNLHKQQTIPTKINTNLAKNNPFLLKE